MPKQCAYYKVEGDARRRNNFVGGALEEETEEQQDFLRGLHREVDVLRLEHGGVRRPAARVAEVRESGTDSIGRRCRSLAEAVRCPAETRRWLVVGCRVGSL